MRCYACDAELNDYESTRKSKNTEEYLDLCEKCFSEMSATLPNEEDLLEEEET